jgi:hypothetical protein
VYGGGGGTTTTIQSACNYKIKTYHAGKKQKGGCKRNPNRGPCGKRLAVTLLPLFLCHLHQFMNMTISHILVKFDNKKKEEKKVIVSAVLKNSHGQTKSFPSLLL